MAEHRYLRRPLGLRLCGLGVVAGLALALGACGGSSKPTPPTAPKPTSNAGARQANARLAAAAGDYNGAYDGFKSRASKDAKAGDVAALKSDAAQFRSGIFGYDAAVRKISFPASTATDVNGLLGASRTAIADLDAVGGANGVADYNRLVGRFNQDNQALIAADNKLSQKLAGGSASAGGSSSTRTVKLPGSLGGGALNSALDKDLNAALATSPNPFGVPAGSKVDILECGSSLNAAGTGRCTFSLKGAKAGYAIAVTIAPDLNSASYRSAGQAPAPSF